MSSVESQTLTAQKGLWELACPVCQHPIGGGNTVLAAEEPGHCAECGQAYFYSAGIWRFLPETRAEWYKDFLREYQTVRADEGWGASHADYYRDLPCVARDDPQASIWQVRAKSFSALLNRVVVPREGQLDSPLKILDLGAGNCWLSHRLAERGHQVAAVDVSTNVRDGLGAHVWYELANRFLPVQAEFDHLPFTSEQFHLVVFNASLHYSADCAVTLAEAARVLHPDGCLIVMDSPVYHDGSSGVRMVEERETAFMGRYGFRSNALPAENFLTTGRLDELAVSVGIHWETFTPFYGVGWLLRPWKARLRGRREPARHPLITGRLLPRKATNAHALTR